MEHLIEIPKKQAMMAFVATCIETTARQTGTNYQKVYQRMKRVGMIEKYIYPNYETLHTMSRENIALDMMECLKKWEAENE